MQVFGSHIFLQWLSEGCPRGLWSERLKDSCGASWNWMCKLLNFVWTLFSEPLHKTSPRVSQLQEYVAGKVQAAVCHGSFVTGVIVRDGGLQRGGVWVISCWHQWNLWNSAAEFWSLRCLWLCWILTEIAADSCLLVELAFICLGESRTLLFLHKLHFFFSSGKISYLLIFKT